MESRIALVGIIVNEGKSVERLNAILHDYGQYIVGRMGVPCRSRGLSVISLVLDAPTSVVSALSGKLGMLDGVSTKTVYPKKEGPCEKAD